MLKGTPLAPLTGVLDLRSPPDEMPAGSMRWRQNFRTTDENKLRRGHGYEKLLSNNSYNNDDLHDQLLVLTESLRQPPTLLFESETSRGVRSLFVANESTIFQHNPNTGNYRVMGTGYGKGETSANGVRFKAARQGDYLIFTNDYNLPLYHLLDSGTSPILNEFEDLETIGLTKAALVFTWKNVVFFADVEMDNKRFPFRILWSDFDNPTSFDPFKAESIASSKDLDSNERILAFEVAGDVGILYTTRGMWQISVVGGEQSFGFKRLYDGGKNKFVGLLKYQNAIVNLGTTHLYLSDDKIYSFSPYQELPSAEEWIHRGSKKLFDELDPAACNAHIGGLDHDEVYFSVTRVGDANMCPSLTLRLNMRYKVADYMDVGFIAFSSFQPYYSQNVRDFIIDKSICTIEELTDQDMGFEDEGLPRSIPGPTAEFEPQTFCTATQSIEVFASSNTVSRERGFTDCFLNTGTPHGLVQGDTVRITGVQGTGYNGTVTVIDAPNPNRIHYAAPIVDFPESLTPDTNGLVEGIFITEDDTVSPCDEDSLCALLGDTRIDDICRKCDTARLFIAVASSDWCVKQLNTVFYRETCTNTDDAGTLDAIGYTASVGEYDQDEIVSLLRPAPAYSKDGDIVCHRFEVKFLAKVEDPVNVLKLRVGISAQPADPNTDQCGLVWHEHSDLDLKCLTNRTAAQHLTNNTQPYLRSDWVFERRGHFMYFEIKIEGTGGDAIFSGMVADVEEKSVRNA